MEGRDIGTVVFPNAFCKIYLTAPLIIRAQRRLEQLRSEGKSRLTLDEVKKAVEDRDHEDMSRQHSPLKKSPDAIELDSRDLTQDHVLLKMREIVQHCASQKGIIL